MGNKSKGLVLVLVLVVSSLFVAIAPAGKAQIGTSVNGIVTSNTVWTKANSPYMLTGPVAVNQGNTLTIEAGAIIELNSHYIQINGNFIAKGSATDQIHINGPSQASAGIIYTQTSNGWNEQSSTGCIIENAVLNATGVSSAVSLKINNSIVYGAVVVSSSALILNSKIYGQVSANSAVISNNTITSLSVSGSAVISDNNIDLLDAGMSTIVNNVITGDVSGLTITANIITGDVLVNSGVVSNNTIIGGKTISDNFGREVREDAAITATGSSIVANNTIKSLQNDSFSGIVVKNQTTVSNNLITGFKSGILGDINSGECLIEKNLLKNNVQAIVINQVDMTILNNTISNCSIAIIDQWNPSHPTINFNNFQNNTQSIYLSGTQNNIDATFNWWGTTDTQRIGLTIYDNKNDFNLGTVTFAPFLTTLNVQAPSLSTSIPTPSPSIMPTQTPNDSSSTLPGSNSEFPVAVGIITAVLIVVVLALAIFWFKKNQKIVKD